MRRRRLLGVVVIAGLALSALPPAGQAQQTAASCGQRITQDLVLANDLLNCPGIGLRAGAANITIDLNGHTIDGDGPNPDETYPDIGIVNGYDPNDPLSPVGAGSNGVTVKNGTIRDFEVGVSWFDPDRTLVDGLITGLSIERGDISLFEANDNRVERNDLTGGAGISVDLGLRNRLTDNRVTGGGISIEQCCRFMSGSSDNLVTRNTVLNSPGDGIGVDGYPSDWYATGNRVLSNTVRGSGGDGIHVGVFTAETLVYGNTATGNGDDGIDVGHDPSFPYPSFPGDGTLTDNVANSNVALGINAAEGVTDGGGNQATGNGDARQCVGVVCRPHGFLFGGGNTGQSFSAMTANAKRATRFFLYYPATVTALRAYLDGGGAASGSQVLRGIIYTDAGGQPGHPITHSFQGAIAAGVAPSWVTLPLPYRVPLGPGYYWLGLHSGNSNRVARFGWNSRANSRAFNIDSYLDGPSDPFGPAPTDDQAIAIHAIGFKRPSG